MRLNNQQQLTNPPYYAFNDQYLVSLTEVWFQYCKTKKHESARVFLQLVLIATTNSFVSWVWALTCYTFTFFFFTNFTCPCLTSFTLADLWASFPVTHLSSSTNSAPYTFSLAADCLWWWNGCGWGWSFYLLLWCTSDLSPTNSIDMLCAASRHCSIIFSSVTPVGSLVHPSLFCASRVAPDLHVRT